MENKTAVEWLYEQIFDCRSFTREELFEQAKEMEKKQIINAYYTGNDDVKDNPNREADQYYNETFKVE